MTAHERFVKLQNEKFTNDQIKRLAQVYMNKFFRKIPKKYYFWSTIYNLACDN